MHQLTPAAGSVMRARGGDAIRRWRQDPDIVQDLAVGCCGDNLTGQGHRRKKRPRCDAIPLVTQTCNLEFRHLYPQSLRYSAASSALMNPPDWRLQNRA